MRFRPHKFPPWVMSQDELGRRVRALLDDKDENGWTPTALGVAANMAQDSRNSCREIIKRCVYRKEMTPRQQVALSRVVLLIESGRLKSELVKVRGCKNPGSLSSRAVLCEPPKESPKTLLHCKIGRGGLKMSVQKQKTYTDAELRRGLLQCSPRKGGGLEKFRFTRNLSAPAD